MTLTKLRQFVQTNDTGCPLLFFLSTRLCSRTGDFSKLASNQFPRKRSTKRIIFFLFVAISDIDTRMLDEREERQVIRQVHFSRSRFVSVYHGESCAFFTCKPRVSPRVSPVRGDSWLNSREGVPACIPFHFPGTSIPKETGSSDSFLR